MTQHRLIDTNGNYHFEEAYDILRVEDAPQIGSKANFAYALGHATLALAQEQRTANALTILGDHHARMHISDSEMRDLIRLVRDGLGFGND